MEEHLLKTNQRPSLPRPLILGAAALFTLSDDRCFCRSRPENGEGAEPRGPYCLMGVCFDCLAEINGIPDTQSCLAVVEDGMSIRLNKDGRP